MPSKACPGPFALYFGTPTTSTTAVESNKGRSSCDLALGYKLDAFFMLYAYTRIFLLSSYIT